MKALARFALRRPYTFVVLAILILVYGIQAIFTTPTDVFPLIDIPVVAAVWSYVGLLPNDVSGRITYYYERAVTSTVENIEHIESDSFFGRNVVRVYFQDGTEIGKAEAEVDSISQTIVQQLPPDISPPMIMSLDASSVPVISLQVTAQDMTPAELYNLAITRLRPQLVTVPGTVVPHPYGGQSNTVLVTLDQQRLRSHKLSAMDVNNAFIEQSIVLPAGDQKIGTVDWMVQTNAVPQTMEEFNNIPIKQVGGAMVRLRDVAWVYQGGPPQTNVVLVDGKQAVMVVIMKGAEASTLDVVQGVKDLIPQMLRTVPTGVDIQVLTDASLFVKESVSDVTRELALATGLTGLVVLLFLGSWRSTIIITTSIPLSMLTSILLLHVTGQTINVMTLGGLALAVGILVDNGTVMIENIDSHVEHGGKGLSTAIVDAAGQMLLPTLVSTICICIVWLPLFQLSGVAGFLFMPMALAIIFAMIPSFVLSQTLVPAMANWMLGGQIEAHRKRKENPNFRGGPFVRFQRGFDSAFLKFRNAYRVLLEMAVNNRKLFVPVFLAAALAAFLLIPYLGRNFFPEIKSGTLQMHMRAPIGTRIEVASRESKLVSDEMRRLLPGEVKDVLVNCGLPVGPHNQAFIPTPSVGAQDCDLTITLNNPQSPVWEFRDVLRKGLREKFPGTVFTFQAAELTEKILNFGLPAPIDVRVSGIDLQDNFKFALELREQIRHVTGAADVEIQQTMTTPTLFLDINRQYALRTGMQEADVAQNELISLSGSQQVEQSYWLDPETGLSYLINIYTPQKLLTNMNQLETIPVTPGDGNPENKVPQLLGAMGEIRPVGTPGEVSHYNILPVIDIYATNEGRDLGAVAADVEEIVAEYQNRLPQGSLMEIRGQFDTMNSAYSQLLFGLGLSILLVFLVIVVNFHSWLDPFIIITALPAALAGIVWALLITRTTLSVPALTGTIMCMGTGTANSILVVAFARERLEAHGNAARAAIEAGYGRIRPVIMTALAMIVGMLPMSMSNSQNAPLGRAVIGGLILATVATLLFVPCMFAILHRDEKGVAEEEGEEAKHQPFNMSRVGRIVLTVCFGVVLVGGAIALVVTDIQSQAQEMAELEEFTEDATVEPVAIIIPREGDPIRELDLPADVEAWYQAPIYARVNGYVEMWEKDFGAVVQRGDVLATINTPRLDAQYRAAKSKLDLANAKLGLAELTARRYKNLEGTQAVSKQQVDVQAANARMQQAEAEATAYKLAELEALESFRTVLAPFDGIVTSREVNVGDYVSELGGPLGAEGDATELFQVADVHKLRIFVHVPQSYIDMLKPGLTAEITVPQYPREVFHAEYLTEATALDTDSRTVTTELVMDNPGNHVWPGSYAEVHFHVPNESKALLVPENALIFQEYGTQLATVDENNHILIKDVQVGRNLGQDVEIISGINPAERVVHTPSAGLVTGQSVRIVLPTPGYNVAAGYNEDQVEAAIPPASKSGGETTAEPMPKTDEGL